MAVPYFDLARARQRVATDVTARWQEVLQSGAFVLGPEVRQFEAAFAEFVDAADAIGVANGTDALVVALRALGLAPGDEVIVPAFTFFATAEAVVLAGGQPVFADVDADTYNLDPEAAAAAVGERTVGILGVHLYGRPFDVAGLRRVCGEHGLWLLEDAAQAQGASHDGQPVGSLGDLASWSFYPSKNLGCFGDGGAITGPRKDLLEKARRIANHGQQGRYHHLEIGTNSRLDSLQAAVLNCRLPLLAEDNASRRRLAERYRRGLAGVGDLAWPRDPDGSTVVYHQMAVRSAHRDGLAEHLQSRGIGSSVHYPSPLHRQPAFAAHRQAEESFPVAEGAARELLCLPMFPELEGTEVDEVVVAIGDYFASHSAAG
ncbi:MAG: DegT/DnrJ/EryC1/StrS family aminotransferase [Acidobacteriota bacterium]